MLRDTQLALRARTQVRGIIESRGLRDATLESYGTHSSSRNRDDGTSYLHHGRISLIFEELKSTDEEEGVYCETIDGGAAHDCVLREPRALLRREEQRQAMKEFVVTES